MTHPEIPDKVQDVANEQTPRDDKSLGVVPKQLAEWTISDEERLELGYDQFRNIENAAEDGVNRFKATHIGKSHLDRAYRIGLVWGDGAVLFIDCYIRAIRASDTGVILSFGNIPEGEYERVQPSLPDAYRNLMLVFVNQRTECQQSLESWLEWLNRNEHVHDVVGQGIFGSEISNAISEHLVVGLKDGKVWPIPIWFERPSGMPGGKLPHDVVQGCPNVGQEVAGNYSEFAAGRGRSRWRKRDLVILNVDRDNGGFTVEVFCDARLNIIEVLSGPPEFQIGGT